MLTAMLSQISHYPLTSNISMSELVDEGIDDGIFSDPVDLEIVQEIFESDCDRNSRIVLYIKASSSGEDLYDYCTNRLPNTGNKCGVALTMNRVMKFLSSKNYLKDIVEDVSVSWRKCSVNLKLKVELIFKNMIPGSQGWLSLIAVLIDGLVPKRIPVKRSALVRSSILDEEEDVVLHSGGRLCDRIALLACAIADPNLLTYWVDISSPVPKKLRPAVMDQDRGIVHEIAAKWSNLAEVIMKSRDLYSNLFSGLAIDGIEGFVLEDINPAAGQFVTTPALSMGEQLKALHTKVRSEYNILLSKISKSGDHAAGGDLILAAYQRTGVENRPKDTSLFYYYMTLKDADLNFMVASLFSDESASEVSDLEVKDVSVETNYAKKQRKYLENVEKQNVASEARQMALIKAVMTPARCSDSESSILNQSLVDKNIASADQKSKNALYLSSLASSEDAKKNAIKIETLMKVINDPATFGLLTQEQQEGLRQQLFLLLGV